MSFISRLLSIYILINYCHNALCVDSNVEIDNLEDQREDNDDYNQDDQQKLFEYLDDNGVADTSRQEDNEKLSALEYLDDNGVAGNSRQEDNEKLSALENLDDNGVAGNSRQEDNEKLSALEYLDDNGVAETSRQEDNEKLSALEYLDDNGVAGTSRQEDNEKLFALEYLDDNGLAGTSRQEHNEDVVDMQELMTLKGKEDKDDNDLTKQIVILDTMDTRNYRAELEAGNNADLMGTNPHYYQPNAYPDFSRRFVPQYLYTEVEKKNKDGIVENKLTPQLVPPELVLQVAKESAIHEAKHGTLKDVHNRNDILRTGDYWNSVWKEDVDPRALRTNKATNLESVRAEIPPGKLYDLILKLKAVSPILYIINEKKSSN